MTAILERDEFGGLIERDLDELPAGKDGRKPELRPSDCENLAGIETGRHTLSHTRISVWLACHRKFELNYLQRLDLIRRPRYFTLGTAYQKAIEYQDPEVGVRFLNGFEPCEKCGGIGRNDTGVDPELRELLAPPCEACNGGGYTGEQIIFHYEDAEREHRVNEAIVRGASALYLKRWPGLPHETREVEYRVRLRSPWTGAYSNTYDLLGYADGVLDPLMRQGVNRLGVGAYDGQHVQMGREAIDIYGAEHQRGGADAFTQLGVEQGDVQGMLDAARAWERGEDAPNAPLEIIENKLVGRLDRADVLSLPLNQQLALERYGLWRATGRPVVRAWFRWMKKPAIQQRGGRKKDKSDAETLDEFCERIVADYDARPDFYAVEEDPKFVTTADLLRIEADLWEVATDMRQRMNRGSDGRRRVFDRNTRHCHEYGGCHFLPICTGDPDARSLYNVRPKRSERLETAPEAGSE